MRSRRVTSWDDTALTIAAVGAVLGFLFLHPGVTRVVVMILDLLSYVARA